MRTPSAALQKRTDGAAEAMLRDFARSHQVWQYAFGWPLGDLAP
jgi:hypothetical protein